MEWLIFIRTLCVLPGSINADTVPFESPGRQAALSGHWTPCHPVRPQSGPAPGGLSGAGPVPWH